MDVGEVTQGSGRRHRDGGREGSEHAGHDGGLTESEKNRVCERLCQETWFTLILRSDWFCLKSVHCLFFTHLKCYLISNPAYRHQRECHVVASNWRDIVNPANPIFEAWLQAIHPRFAPWSRRTRYERESRGTAAVTNTVKGHYEVSSCLGIRLIAEIYGVRHRSREEG